MKYVMMLVLGWVVTHALPLQAQGVKVFFTYVGTNTTETYQWLKNSSGFSSGGATINARLFFTDGAGTPNVYNLWTTCPGCGGVSNLVASIPAINSGNPSTNRINYVGPGEVKTNCIDTISVYNPSVVVATYQVNQGGNDYGWIQVNPGCTATFTIPNPTCSAATYTVQLLTDIRSAVYNGTNQQVVPCGFMSIGGGVDATPGDMIPVDQSTTGPGGPPPAQANITVPPSPAPLRYTNNLTGTNSSIVYTNIGGTTNVATDSTIQQGFNALYSANIQGNQALIDAVGRGAGQVANAIGGLANTNAAGNGTLHSDLTNILGHLGASNDTSGSFGTNVGITLPTLAGAQASSASAMAGPISSLDGMATTAGGVVIPVDDSAAYNESIPAGSVNGNTFAFSFHPETSEFSVVFVLAHKLWVLVLIFLYAGRILTELVKFFVVMVNAKGVEVQNMGLLIAGTGGNALGVAMAPLVITLVLALWAASLAVGISAITGAIDWTSLFAQATGDPLVGMPAGGKHLLFATFPVILAFSLATAYLVFRITWFKAAILVAAAIKFVFGA